MQYSVAALLFWLDLIEALKTSTLTAEQRVVTSHAVQKH